MATPLASILGFALLAVPLAGSVRHAPRPADEVDRRLVSLASSTGADRASAERWLGTHVRSADFPRLAEAAERGDAEVRGRIARAVGSDDRHLALAVLFLEEPRRELSEIGARAIERMVARFNPSLARVGIAGPDLRSVLFDLGRRSAPQALALDPNLSLEESADLLGRTGQVPLPVVCAPALRERTPRSTEGVAVGAWEELVVRLGKARAVGLEAHGIDRDLERPRGWLYWVPPVEEGTKTGFELVLEWCRMFTDPNGAARVDAARSLAACGWPAALEWLEERWQATGDVAALEGCLLAAATGRVVLSLRDPSVVRELIARAERDLDRGGDAKARAHRVVRALEQVGCRGRRGGDLALVVLAGSERASPRGRWLRLALFEAWGCSGSDEAVELTRAVLEDPVAPAPLRLQALRTWSALTAGTSSAGDDPLRLADPVQLLAAVRSADDARELVALLVSSRAEPPSAWAAAAGGSQDVAFPVQSDLGRAIVLGWWFGRRELELAAALLVAPGVDDTTLLEAHAAVLRGAVLAGERRAVQVLIARARTLAPDKVLALDRLALLAGAHDDPAAFGAARGDSMAQEPLASLGVLAGSAAARAGGDVGRRAQSILFERLEVALQAGAGFEANRQLLSAFERALEELYGAADDLGAEVLLVRIERSLAPAARSRLAAEIRARRWPPPPRGAALDPRELERHCDL